MEAFLADGGKNTAYKRHRRRGSAQVRPVAKKAEPAKYICRPDPMVFQVHFGITPGIRRPSWDDLRQFLSGFSGINFCRTPDGLQSADYYNPATRVGCRFANYAPVDKDGCEIVFELPLPCPTFFAMETLVMGLALAREFKLAVRLYSSNFSGGEWAYQDEPIFSDARAALDQLLFFWNHCNEEARHSWEELNGPAPEFRRTDLELVWEYRTLDKVFRKRYMRQGYTYADISLVQSQRTGEVFTLSEWSDLGKAVFPAVDLVRIRDAEKYGVEDMTVYAGSLFEIGREHIKSVPIPMRHYVTKEGLREEKFLSRLKAQAEPFEDAYRAVPYKDIKDI
ncbi:hypothetical protein IJT93_10090 [bacterium]|nr:hypothetical protein [bacterium]